MKSAKEVRLVVVGLLLFASMAGAQGAQEDGPASLRWRLAEGDRFQVSFTQSTQTISTVGKNALRMRLEQGAELGWLVQSVDDSGNMHIEQTIARLRLKMTKSDGTDAVDYDSSSTDPLRGAARDVANSAGPLVGLKIQLTLSPRGEVVAVQLPEETRAAIEKIQDRSQVAALLTPDGISDVLKQATPLLPEQPVAPGDSWNIEAQKKLPSGALQQTTTLTYQGTNETMAGLHKITVAGELALKADASAPTKLVLKEQQLAGTLWFNEMQGHIARGTIEQQLVTESPYRDELINVRLTTQLVFQFDRVAAEQ